MDALKRWFYSSIISKVLDVATTLYLVYQEGPSVESHPFTTGMISTYGAAPGLVLNGAIVCMLLWALYKHKRKRLLIVSTIILMAIVLTNMVTVSLSVILSIIS